MLWRDGGLNRFFKKIYMYINIHNSWESHLLFRGPCSMIKWQLPVTYIWIEHNRDDTVYYSAILDFKKKN